jgi:4-amino-4-deoxy-L-arabinose transferase-like glycosyltransferase
MTLPAPPETLATGRSGESGDRLSAERLARFAPWVLVGYVVLQCLIRLALSSNLEADEAQFVGQIDFRWGYGNSQGPLYNWLVGLAHGWSGSWPVAVAAPKHLFLAATYVLQYDLVRRLTGSAVAGAAGAFALLLVPQIAIISEITLAHTVMVQAAVTATLHALVLIFERRSLWRYLWLGIAVSIGILGKYNFLLVVIALVAVALVVPEIKRRLASPLLLATTALVVAAIAPHLVWVIDHRDTVAERLDKMTERNDLFYWSDLPAIGIDGFLALLWGVAVAVLPLYLVWRLATGFSQPPRPAPLRVDMSEAAVRRLLLFAWLLPVSIFAVLVLALDAHDVRLRYVTPLIMSFPVWVGLVRPVADDLVAARRIVAAAAAFAAIVLVGWPVSVMTVNGPFNYPYGEMAAAVAETVEPPYAVMAPSGVDQNLVARIDGTALWDANRPAGSVLVVVRGDRLPEDSADQLGDAYTPAGESQEASFRGHYLIDRMHTLRWRLFERQPDQPAAR